MGWGWTYHFRNLTKAQLANGPSTQPWMPAVLEEGQFLVVSALCRGDLSLSDQYLIQAADTDGQSLDAFVRGLVDTRLVALRGDALTLITTECGCVLLPDGRRIAGENNTGRLTRWLDKFMAERAEEAGAAE